MLESSCLEEPANTTLEPGILQTKGSSNAILVEISGMPEFNKQQDPFYKPKVVHNLLEFWSNGFLCESSFAVLGELNLDVCAFSMNAEL